jgi:hypothetical protein
MTRHLTAFALACFAVTGVAVAAELAPINAHSIRLARFDGIVYYTVEQDGYRVVATLASGPEELPIRFVATLRPEQHLLISVPQPVGQSSIDVEIRRNGDALVVSGANPTVTVGLVDQMATGTAPDE